MFVRGRFRDRPRSTPTSVSPCSSSLLIRLETNVTTKSKGVVVSLYESSGNLAVDEYTDAAMLEGTRRWFRRNRTRFAVGAGTLGLVYLAGQYAWSKWLEARQRMADERISKEK